MAVNPSARHAEAVPKFAVMAYHMVVVNLLALMQFWFKHFPSDLPPSRPYRATPSRIADVRQAYPPLQSKALLEGGDFVQPSVRLEKSKNVHLGGVSNNRAPLPKRHF